MNTSWVTSSASAADPFASAMPCTVRANSACRRTNAATSPRCALRTSSATAAAPGAGIVESATAARRYRSPRLGREPALGQGAHGRVAAVARDVAQVRFEEPVERRECGLAGAAHGAVGGVAVAQRTLDALLGSTRDELEPAD